MHGTCVKIKIHNTLNPQDNLLWSVSEFCSQYKI